MLKYLLIAGFLLGGVGVAGAQPRSTDLEKQAAAHFERGRKLYQQGRFPAAIKAYSAAHRLAPHPDALFNIARCQENIGKYDEALKFYKQALEETKDPASHADITRRIGMISRRPVKVFVTSQPSGARVTVDGNARPAQGMTPLVLLLEPGKHVLLVRKDGYRLGARRVEVQVAKEQTVEEALVPLPGSCPPPAPACPRPKKCPRLALTDTDNLHLQLAAIGGFGFTVDRPSSGGPGFQLNFTYKRLIVGAHFLWLPIGEQAVTLDKTNLAGKLVRYHEIQQRWLLMQLEGGYVWPWESFYLYATGGLGISMDRVSYIGRELEVVDKNATPHTYRLKTETDNKSGEVSYFDVSDFIEETAFAWSIGGGIQTMATSWMSVGAAARFGMIHGSRAVKENPGDSETANVPYGILWGSISFHL